MILRYSRFVPKLYNWCKTLGFETGKIVPSRTFCSDESQGCPIILTAKHFGAFPFNPDRIDLEDAIHIMEEALEVHVHTPQRPGKG